MLLPPHTVAAYRLRTNDIRCDDILNTDRRLVFADPRALKYYRAVLDRLISREWPTRPASDLKRTCSEPLRHLFAWSISQGNLSVDSA